VGLSANAKQTKNGYSNSMSKQKYLLSIMNKASIRNRPIYWLGRCREGSGNFFYFYSDNSEFWWTPGGILCVFTTDTREWEAEEEGNVQVFIHHRSKAYGRGLNDTW